MAVKLYTEPINKTIDWGGDANTNGLPVSGEQVQKFIKDTLAKKFGYMYYDKTQLTNDAGVSQPLTGTNQYIIFADEDDFNAWTASGGADNTYVLGRFDAPAPAVIEISEQSKQVNTILTSEVKKQALSFKYLVKDSAGVAQKSDMSILIQINNNLSGVQTLPLQTLEMQMTDEPILYSFDQIGEYLSEGTNTITITVTSLAFNVSTNVIYQYRVLNLMIANSSFEDSNSNFYYYNGISLTNEEEPYFQISFDAMGTGTKYLRAYIDGKNIDGEEIEGETKPSHYIGSNSPQNCQLTLEFKNTETGENYEWAQVGKHSIQFYFFVLNEAGEEIKSQTLYYDFVLTEPRMNPQSYILLSRSLDQGQLVQQGETLQLATEQYESIAVDYAVYDTSGRGNNSDASAVIINLTLYDDYENQHIVEDPQTVEVPSGSKTTFIHQFNTYGNLVLAIENTATGGETIPININVKKSSIQIEPESGNLVLELSALNRTNSEPYEKRTTWEYVQQITSTISKSYKAEFNNVLWNNQSGWLDNCLVLNNGATVTIPVQIFSSAEGNCTFEIDFETANVQDDDANIMTYGTENGAHIIINACNAEMKSEGGNSIHTNYKENSRQKIQFIFNPKTEGNDNGYLMYMVVNGILDRAAQFTDNLGDNRPTSFTIGNLDGKATIKIHSIRVYNDALTLDECVNNYIYDSSNIRQKYLKNDVYIEGSTINAIDPNKILNSDIHIPVMIIYGDPTESIVKTFNKKANIPVDVLYRDPEDSQFNFFVHNAWLSNQGTSSMYYPRRNLRLYLNKVADDQSIRGYGDAENYLYQTRLYPGLTDAAVIAQIQQGQLDLNEPITIGDNTYYPMCNKKWTRDDGSVSGKKDADYYDRCTPVSNEKGRWLWHSGVDLLSMKEVLVNPDDPSEGTKKEWKKIKNYKAEVAKGTQLYALGAWARFKAKDLYTDRWTIKCDYAESSMTHNAGVGRLWGDVLKGFVVGSGGYRYDTEGNKINTTTPGITNAQNAVKEYEARTGQAYGDIRTSCDGKPIIVINYPRLRDAENNVITGKFGDPIFLGLHNIMTDKGSTPLFGFEDLRDDDDTLLYDAGNDTQRTECWECLQNGSQLAQMSTIVTDDTDGSEVGYSEDGSDNEDRPIFKTYEARWPDNDDLNDTLTNKLETVIRFVNFCKDAVNVSVDGKDGYTLSDFTEIKEEEAELLSTYATHPADAQNDPGLSALNLSNWDGKLYLGIPSTNPKIRTSKFYATDEEGNIMRNPDGTPMFINKEDNLAALEKLANKIYYYQDYKSGNVATKAFTALYDETTTISDRIDILLAKFQSPDKDVYEMEVSTDPNDIDQQEMQYFPNSGYTWFILDSTYDRNKVSKVINTAKLTNDVYTGKVYTFDGKRLDSEGQPVNENAWVTVYLSQSGNRFTYVNEMGEVTPYNFGDQQMEVGSGNGVNSGESFKGHTLMEYFKDKKYEHFDIWKLAAYYVYMMRFAAVDQVIKNTMMTTEDGQHYYFINYDNDTILGVRNDGYLAYDWQITRESYDESIGSYCYAGFGSVLWNLLEQDEDFMDKVKTCATSFVTSNLLTYDIAIDMFNNKQSGTWSERLYNSSEMYKYISTYNDSDNKGKSSYNPYSNTKYLPFLQGSRASHRDWWLRHRFDLYDSKWSAGEYSQAKLDIYIGINASPSNPKEFLNIVAGSKFYYTITTNNRLFSNNFVELSAGQTHTFTTTMGTAIGDPLSVLGAYKIKVFDVSGMRDTLGSSITFNWDVNKYGSMMTELIIGGPKTLSEQPAGSCGKLVNLGVLGNSLEVLDIRTNKFNEMPDISKLTVLKKFLASDSNIVTFLPAEGLNLEEVSLPSTIQNIVMKNITIAQPTEEELESGITTKFNYTPNVFLTHVELINVEGIDIIDFINTWYKELKSNNVLMTNYSCTLSFGDIEIPEEIDGVKGIDWLNNIRKDFGINPFTQEYNFNIIKGNILIHGDAVDGAGEPTGGITQENYEELLKYWPQSFFESDKPAHFNSSKSLFINVTSSSPRFRWDDVSEEYVIVGGQTADINVTIFPADNSRLITLIPSYLNTNNNWVGPGNNSWQLQGNNYVYNFNEYSIDGSTNTIITNNNGSVTFKAGEHVTNKNVKHIALQINDSLDPYGTQKIIKFRIEDPILPSQLTIFDEAGQNITGNPQTITNIDKTYKYKIEFPDENINVDIKSINATFGNTNISENENGVVRGYMVEEPIEGDETGKTEVNMYVEYTPKLNKGETINTEVNIKVNVFMSDKNSTQITNGNIITIIVKTNNISGIVIKSNDETLEKNEQNQYIIENYIRNISDNANQVVYHYDVNINPLDFNVKINKMVINANIISNNIQIPSDRITRDVLTNAITGFDVVVTGLRAKNTIYERHTINIEVVAEDSHGTETAHIIQEIDLTIGCFYPDDIKLIKNENAGLGWETNYLDVDLLNGEQKNVNYELHIYSMINGQPYYWCYDTIAPGDDVVSVSNDGTPHYLISSQLPETLIISPLTIECEAGRQIEVINGEISNSIPNTAYPKFSFQTITSNGEPNSVEFTVNYKITFNGKDKLFTQTFTIFVTSAIATQGQWQNISVDSVNLQNNFYVLDKNLKIYNIDQIGHIEGIMNGAENIITALLYIYEDNNANKKLLSVDPWLLRSQESRIWYDAERSTFATHQYGKTISYQASANNGMNPDYNLLMNLSGYSSEVSLETLSTEQLFEAMYNVYAFITAYAGGTNVTNDGGTYRIINKATGSAIQTNGADIYQLIDKVKNGEYTISKRTTREDMIFNIFDYYKSKYNMNVNGRLLSSEEIKIFYTNRDLFAIALNKLDDRLGEAGWKQLLFDDANLWIMDSAQEAMDYRNESGDNIDPRFTNGGNPNMNESQAIANSNIGSNLTESKFSKVFWSTDNSQSTVAKMPITQVFIKAAYRDHTLIIPDPSNPIHSAKLYNLGSAAPTDNIAYCLFTPSI